MKTSCNKVKNPCKFCLLQVTNKNGLQCQGACKKWAHYKCLQYTPGKISDIKAGIIKITCPCPDCDTTEPKEFLSSPPFTCTNFECPANNAAKCPSRECSSNKKQRSSTPSTPATLSSPPTPPTPDYNVDDCTNSACSNEAVPCPAVECPNSRPQKQMKPHPRMSSPRPPTPPHASPKSPTGSGCCPKSRCPGQENSEPSKKKQKQKDKQGCPADCERDKKRMKSSTGKSPSCSLISTDSLGRKGVTSSSSDSRLGSPKNQVSMLDDIQEMCTTVGKLSVQLKELMCKMMQ